MTPKLLEFQFTPMSTLLQSCLCYAVPLNCYTLATKHQSSFRTAAGVLSSLLSSFIPYVSAHLPFLTVHRYSFITNKPATGSQPPMHSARHGSAVFSNQHKRQQVTRKYTKKSKALHFRCVCTNSYTYSIVLF